MAILTALVLLATTQAQPIGSRENPVPIGTSVDMGFWQIKVLKVVPHATEEDVYGSEPKSLLRYELLPGTEYFVAEIQATYIGSGSGQFDCSDLSVVGPSSVGYVALGYQASGIIPNYFPNFREVFTGGTIKGIVVWLIPPADANHLVMYNNRHSFEYRDHMALFEE